MDNIENTKLGKLKIIKAGSLCSIQDLGRKGWAFYAIPQSGAMDSKSASLANEILGNPENNPVIECTGIAATIEFQSDASISLTGGDPSWLIDGQPISRYKNITIKKGQILSGGKITHGFRSYIAINGILETQEIYGSSSFYLNANIGGHNGQLIKAGDVLKWHEIQSTKATNFTNKPRPFISKIKLKKGPEFDFLDTQSKSALTENVFYISKDSNRMGARLEGDKLSDRLHCTQPSLLNSVVVFPGILQVPPSGQILVILQDGQTTGGYPRIAYIDASHLDFFNQIAIGRAVKFQLKK